MEKPLPVGRGFWYNTTDMSMPRKNFSKYIFIVLPLIILAIHGCGFGPGDESGSLAGGTSSVSQGGTTTGTTSKSNNEDRKINLSGEKLKLFKEFRSAIDAEDYQTAGRLLGLLYEKNWIKEKQFNDLERDVYIKVDKKYFTVGNYKRSEEICTTIYTQAPLSGRFLYLRVISLEALGRRALSAGDLEKAEEYAMRILRMTFRLEGSNLLADVYIKKIRGKIAAGNKTAALNDLNKISDYEISGDDRKNALNDLRKELEL